MAAINGYGLAEVTAGPLPAYACRNCKGSGFVWRLRSCGRCPACDGDGIDPDYYAEWNRRGESMLAAICGAR